MASLSSFELESVARIIRLRAMRISRSWSFSWAIDGSDIPYCVTVKSRSRNPKIVRSAKQMLVEFLDTHGIVIVRISR